MGIPKIISGWEFNDSPSVTMWTPGVRLTKLGAYGIESELNGFLGQRKPEKGHSWVLVNALGSSEYWGANRNNDLFPKDELYPDNYKSFMDGHVFTSHVNKDPKKARGLVPFAAYNPNMEKVELVLDLPHNKNEDILDGLASDKQFAVSMGCRVAGDECSDCHNFARTKAEYCDHIKKELGVIRPNGIVVGMINRKPRFFDISVVNRPAAREAMSLAKVASFNEFTMSAGGIYVRPDPIIINTLTDSQVEKFASFSLDAPPSVALAEVKEAEVKPFIKSSNIRKASDITKKLPPMTISKSDLKTLPELYERFGKVAMPLLREAEQVILPDVLDKYADECAPEFLSTLAMNGVILKPSEFQTVMLNKESSARLLESNVSFLDFDPIKVAHDRLSGGFDRILSANKYDAGIAKKFAHVIEKKSYFRNGLLSRVYGAENSDVDGIFPASHFLMDDPLQKTAEINLEEIPKELQETLGKVAGLFESYIEAAQNIARSVLEDADGMGKIAESMQSVTFRDLGHVEKICPVGLPGLLFGIDATKLALEMEEVALSYGFDKEASFKMANRALESGVVFNRTDINPLLIDCAIMIGMGIGK